MPCCAHHTAYCSRSVSEWALGARELAAELAAVRGSVNTFTAEGEVSTDGLLGTRSECSCAGADITGACGGWTHGGLLGQLKCE